MANMAKREAEELDDKENSDRRAKRLRFSNANNPARNEPAKIEDIYNARQLQTLLRFQQDGDLKSGIQSFKAFLDSILYPEDRDDVGTKRAILEEFLQSQTPRSGDLQHTLLEDVMQTWSFASQSNNDGLVSSVTAVLALLLRFLSTQLELRQHGISLCKSLLRLPVLKLIRRSLSAPKHKPFIISPVLRLLTELVSFDGGVLAKEVYSHREYTFEPKIIAHLISSRDEVQSQDPTKPTVRSNAIRYLLANFRYQNEGVKVDIIKQGNISRALFANVDRDAPALVKDILDVLRAHVILDEEIPRGNKTYLLDDRNLSSILSVCRRQDEVPDEQVTTTPLQRVALEFLRFVCTTPNLGVLLSCPAWYSSSEDDDGDQLDLDLGFPVPLELNSFNVRNTTLASFIHILRPYASEQEMGLIIDIFKAAPELVADYFTKKSTFTFEPALTVTWIGYAAFLFSVVSLPAPVLSEYQHRPPSVSIAVDSIVPRPLTQHMLRKCINNNSDTVRFFVSRILTIILDKVRTVVTEWRDRGETSWATAAERLEHQVGQRFPNIQDVVTLMQQSKSKEMQYEASTRLIRLYYEVLPWIALEAKLDVSASITLELQELEDGEADGAHPGGMRSVTLSHLLAIAQFASGMQWWKKPQGLRYSPFTTLLSLAAADEQFASQNSSLIKTLAEETGTYQAALIALLKTLNDTQRNPAILDFLDNCVGRLVRAPIKYVDDLEIAIAAGKYASMGSQTLSPLLMTIGEQLAFKKGPELKSISQWFAAFTAELEAGVDRCKNADTSQDIAIVPDSSNRDYQSSFANHKLPKESTKLIPLQRWLQDDLTEVLETGLSAPLLLICSSDDSIRRQAILSLAKFITRFDPTDVDHLQHCVLLSEMQETIQVAQDNNEQAREQCVPYTVVTFAIHAAAVLSDPTHALYPKLNTFMNEGPSWSISRLPSYWMQVIIDSPPEDDTGNAAWDEVDWLLTWLYDALRSAKDMDILRRCRVFEKVLAQYDGAPRSIRTRSLDLLTRAMAVEGGSTTLITRFGMLDWLRAQAARATRKDDRELLLALRKHAWDVCDQARVKVWSHGEVARTI